MLLGGFGCPQYITCLLPLRPVPPYEGFECLVCFRVEDRSHSGELAKRSPGRREDVEVFLGLGIEVGGERCCEGKAVSIE